MREYAVLGAAALAAAVCVGVGVYRRYFAVLDVPNHRSSHTLPIPRGAGSVFVIAWSVACLVSIGSVPADEALVGIILLATAAGAVGAWDDRASLRTGIRLLFHFALAGCVLVLLGGVAPVSFGALGTLAATGPLFVLGVLGVVWLLNLYNFMDGTDGIAACEAIFVCVVGGLVLWSVGDIDRAVWLLYLAACMVGFLVWNLPPARVFMGDAGSAFLGFLFAIVALSSHNADSTSLWFWAILLGAFIVDATTTLVRRAFSGARVWEAHRTHAYQRVFRRSGSHSTVIVGVVVIDMAWLLPLALLAHRFPGAGFAICVLAYVPLSMLALCLGAGREPDQ